ncbi:hypothetical protein Tco_0834551 [Tanacetum coccineum]
MRGGYRISPERAKDLLLCKGYREEVGDDKKNGSVMGDEEIGYGELYKARILALRCCLCSCEPVGKLLWSMWVSHEVTAQAKEIKALKAQGRKSIKSFKGEPSMHKDPAFDDLDDFVDVDDTLDYMESEDAQNEGRTSSVVLEEKESANEGVSTEALVSIDKQYEGTNKKNDGTDKQDGGTNSTKVSTDKQGEVFGDDETIAQVLIIMSQNKEKLKEKEKGVELKDVEEIERPGPTSTRSLLTLKPHPKIDLKDKGKKMIEEEDESDTESEDITEVEKKFKQLANDEEVARKVQEEWEAEEEKKRLAEEEATKVALSNEYDFIQARLNADKILAEKLQEEEREMYTIEVKKDDSVKGEIKEEEGIRKRKLGKRKKMKSKKRKFTSKDDEELRLCLTIVSAEDKEVDYDILDKKYPIIEWRSEYLTTKPQYDETKELEDVYLNVVTRSNKQRRYFSTLMTVLSILDRDDICAIYQLVMNRYQDETHEGFNKILWGDLIIISSGVHTIMTGEGLVIHMLVENKYPLTKKVLSILLELKLETEEDSTMALELIRFVKK